MKTLKVIIMLLVISTNYIIGQVVVTDISDTTIYSGDSLYIDINNDQINDFMFTCIEEFGTLHRAQVCTLDSNIVTTSKPWPTAIGFYVSMLNNSDTIFSGLNWDSLPGCRGLYGTAGYFEFPGYFMGAVDAFIGLQLFVTNDFYYCWIQVDVSSNADWITVKGYAYESTPNTPIIIQKLTNNNITRNNDLNQIYPNPIEEGISINGINCIDKKRNISIYNMQGVLVCDLKNYHNNYIDLRSLDSGFYILIIESKKGVFEQKFVKK